MKVLKSWLKEYIEFDWSDQELSDKLSYSGTLVDEYFQEIDSLVVVAEIKKIKKHPNADKLSLVKVFNGSEDLDIVCGAKNIAEGNLVPLAQVGAKLKNGEIKKAKIRDVESNGMLCSEMELGLGTNHDGILILDKEKSKVGQKLNEIYENDTIFDLEITPNRGDCNSHIGVAREIAAIKKESLKKVPIELKMSSENASGVLSLEIKNLEKCPRYFARVVKNVKIAESPDWLKEKLIKSGLSPINNVVDITNYTMLDLGQPMHAFDLKKISKSKIVVRNAKNGENIKALDESNYKLSAKDLVIADANKPIAIAGIIGGYDSQIDQETTDVVLEAAEFERTSVRKSSKELSVVTEASYRFERGIDPSAIEYAINKAAKMIQEIACGTILSGIVKIDSAKEINLVSFNENQINQLLGTNLSKQQIDDILRSLGFKVVESTATVPSWRHDVKIWQDLAEEVARIIGLNEIKLVPISKEKPAKKSAYYYKEHIKDLLVAEGFSEVFSYSFLSDKDVAEAGLKANDMPEVANPIQPENKYLRPSIIPGLLSVIAKNSSFDPIFIFEIANTFSKTQEKTKLSIAASGKGSSEAISNVKEILTKKIKGAEIKTNEISREELSRFKIRKPKTYVFEMDLFDIEKKMKLSENELKLKVSNKEIIYRPISKYPSITRDLAFVLNKKTKSEEVKKTIYDVSDYINRVELFDEFASDKLGKGKKNLAYHIYLQAMDQTLTDREADKIIKSIISKIEKEYSAKLRG